AAEMLRSGANDLGGTLMEETISRMAGSSYAWILNDLYVAPSGRRTGAGRALLREVLRRARAEGVAGVQLETAYDNRRAQALYESEGFVREEFHVYFHDFGVAKG
ncbi:GNAT family N-acetyltransferase, partial [Streptomyces sp. NPDC048551]|uniref:GNAT family N-acetyltransferase n=1 Tax=Streptomyces sp. NPDC048551 TaxID=3155758 RepID=UPI003444D1CA